MKVFVYYNLHRKLWSVKALEGPDKGKVIARLHTVVLHDVVPKVSEAGRQRVLQDKRKNVHAGLVGHYSPSWQKAPRGLCLSNDDRISYNPYKSGNFYYIQEPNRVYTGSTGAILLATGKPEVYTF